jgi:hypothetical protein
MDYYYPTTNTFNVSTGGISRSYSVFNMKKVLILPTNLERDFDYDIAFLAANKNFTFGGFFDKDNVVVLIKYADLRGHIPVLEDHVIYLNKKWQVKKSQEYADLQCYIVNIISLKGESFSQIFNLNGYTNIEVSQNA